MEIELFCRGLRLEESFDHHPHRRISRTRAGLGSGLEIIIPARPKPIWMNVPVAEAFAARSPFMLLSDDRCQIVDQRDGETYPIDLPPEPAWYSRLTSFDTPMSRIGILQGNYLGIYVGGRCAYWSTSSACKFCTTGKNVGSAEESRKRVEEVIEVSRAARQESGAIFTHFNTGYQYEDRDDRLKSHGLMQCKPYVDAVRRKVGGFIGVQAIPVLRRNFHLYEELIGAGVDHFSFCYEFEDPAVFADICPGKANTIGQKAFFEAMTFTSRRLGPGRVSGEIIAGVEPVAATKRGIDRIIDCGAFPTVCIFRPTIGSAMEDCAPPDPEGMKEVFAYLHERCRSAGLPIGILPIEVSLVVQPEETAALVERSLADRWYRAKNWTLRQMARPYIAWKLRPTG